MNTVRVGLIMAVFLFVGCHAGAKPAPLSREAEARRIKLLEAIEATDLKPCHHMVRNKLLQELAGMGVYDKRYCKTLLAAALAEGGMDWGAWGALAAAGEQAVPLLVKELDPEKFTGEDAENFPVLLCLGQMGPSAKGAIPALQKLLGDAKIKSETKMSIRVVLANAGFESKENLALILKSLRDKSEAAGGAVRTIARIRPGAWVTDDIVAELSKLIQDPDIPKAVAAGTDFAAWLAIAVGSLGERGRVAIKPLTEALNELAEKSNRRIVYWAALARMQPEGAKRTEAVRMMLKSTRGMEREDIVVVLDTTACLVDEPMRAQIVKFIDDKDTDVVYGAISQLMLIGKEDARATASLMALVQKSEDESVRRNAASVMTIAASFKDAPQLEKLQAAEKDEAVQKVLALGIAVLKLDWKKAEEAAKALD